MPKKGTRAKWIKVGYFNFVAESFHFTTQNASHKGMSIILNINATELNCIFDEV